MPQNSSPRDRSSHAVPERNAGSVSSAQTLADGYRFKFGPKFRQDTLNVYEGDRAVCQCHNERDARLIVAAMNEKRDREFHLVEPV
jgi:hypothetical protein